MDRSPFFLRPRPPFGDRLPAGETFAVPIRIVTFKEKQTIDKSTYVRMYVVQYTRAKERIFARLVLTRRKTQFCPQEPPLLPEGKDAPSTSEVVATY